MSTQEPQAHVHTEPFAICTHPDCVEERRSIQARTESTVADLRRELAEAREERDKLQGMLVRGSDAAYWMNRTREAEAELKATLEQAQIRLRAYEEVLEQARHDRDTWRQRALDAEAKAVLADYVYENWSDLMDDMSDFLVYYEALTPAQAEKKP